MITIPLTLLALAAGIALLIKVKKETLGGLYKGLAWLVVILSLLYMICCVARGIRYNRDGGHYGRHCGYEKEFYSRGGASCCSDMKCDGGVMGGKGCCEMTKCCKEGGEEMSCCKHGDGGRMHCDGGDMHEKKVIIEKDTVVKK